MNLTTWALKWRIPAAALVDLTHGLHLDPPPVAGAGGSEARAQSEVRLEASRVGCTLWRNNVGALLDKRGVPVRYGLANDSAALNARIKSADLIGWRRVQIGPEHVGAHMAQFLSREIKEPGWRYTGTPHEVAQLAWARLVLAAGGDAGFATGIGTLTPAATTGTLPRKHT